MATDPVYEVYALKYGERDTTKCQFFYREGSHDKLTLHYFVWLILGGPHPVLVDTGFLEDDAQARHIRDYVSPPRWWERVGIKPADIPVTLISHLHYDHWAGHSLFPKSEFWMQKDEVAFWTGRFGGTPAFRGSANVNALAGLVTLNYANRIRIVEGDREVLPGLRVHRVGGHTAGLQIVTVQHGTGAGRPHLRRLALLPQRGDAPAGADHHEPARDGAGVRTIHDAGRAPEADRRRPRPPGLRAVQTDRTRHREDRVGGHHAVAQRRRDRRAAAGRDAAFPGPVPTQIVSSEEYFPTPQTAAQREVEARTKALGDELARDRA